MYMLGNRKCLRVPAPFFKGTHQDLPLGLELSVKEVPFPIQLSAYRAERLNALGWGESKEVTSRRDGMDANEARANALWLISHECLHVRQQREMGCWRFLVAYVWMATSQRRGTAVEAPATGITPNTT